jgi:hypothetical protein
MLPILGALVFTAGIAYIGCAFLEPPPPQASRASRRLEARERQLGVLWILTGLILILLGTLLKLMVLLSLVGGGICWALHRRGHVLAVRWDQLPEAGRRHVKGSQVVKILLALPFLVIFYTGFAYAGLEAVEVYQEALPSEGTIEQNESDPPSEGGGSGRHFSYAELCKKLSDPQQIGYGLGDLFEHDGAVAAGCGEPAIRVGGSTWVSPGFCGTELRSLAVVGEGREPVLLYGAPARFAWSAAHNRDLRFAEAADFGGGEVALVGIANGTVAFVRSSPALKPGDQDARRCEEVDEIARPYIELEAPMAALWREYMVIENEWIWPEAVERVDDVVLRSSEALPVYGSCESRLVCRLDGPGLHRFSEGPATISLEQLAPYAPTAPDG